MKEAEKRWSGALEALFWWNFIPVMFLVIFGFCSHGAIVAAGDKLVDNGEFWLCTSLFWLYLLSISVFFAFGEEITE